MAPAKTVTVKNNANEWFGGKIAEKIATGDKFFRKFKMLKLCVDEVLYKEVRNIAQALIFFIHHNIHIYKLHKT